MHSLHTCILHSRCWNTPGRRLIYLRIQKSQVGVYLITEFEFAFIYLYLGLAAAPRPNIEVLAQANKTEEDGDDVAKILLSKLKSKAAAANKGARTNHAHHILSQFIIQTGVHLQWKRVIRSPSCACPASKGPLHCQHCACWSCLAIKVQMKLFQFPQVAFCPQRSLQSVA